MKGLGLSSIGDDATVSGDHMQPRTKDLSLLDTSQLIRSRV